MEFKINARTHKYSNALVWLPCAFFVQCNNITHVMWKEIPLFALAARRLAFSAAGVRLRVNLVMTINISEKAFTFNKSPSAVKLLVLPSPRSVVGGTNTWRFSDGPQVDI